MLLQQIANFLIFTAFLFHVHLAALNSGIYSSIQRTNIDIKIAIRGVYIGDGASSFSPTPN